MVGSDASLRYLFLYGSSFRLSLLVGQMARGQTSKQRSARSILQLLNSWNSFFFTQGEWQEWTNTRSVIRRSTLQLLNSCNS